MRGQVAAEVRKMKKMSRSAVLAVNVGGVAFAIECLELLLVDKGVLRDNELMDKIKAETEKRTEAIKHGHNGRINAADVDFEASHQPGGEGGQSQQATVGEIED